MRFSIRFCIPFIEKFKKTVGNDSIIFSYAVKHRKYIFQLQHMYSTVQLFFYHGHSITNFLQAGLTAADVEIGDWLRKNFSHKHIVLAVNKCESPRKGMLQASDFWALG